MATAPLRGSILIVDGPAALPLRDFAMAEGYGAEIAGADAALEAAASGRFDAVVADLDSAAHEGRDLFASLAALDPDLPVVAVTPLGSAERAADALRRGARDFVRRPWDPARLSSILRNQVELGRALKELRRLKVAAGR